jgi:hypothetical protein
MQDKTFEELKAFIELNAAKYAAVDEGEDYGNLWQCDIIYTAVLNEIAIFALNEGLVLDGVDLALYVENITKNEEDFVDYEEWQMWSDEWTDLSNNCEVEVRNAMSELAEQKQLPEKTQILHDFWQRSFYPKFYSEYV